MRNDEFTIVWKMLVGIWPRLDADETVAAWWGLLGHYPAHQTSASVRNWAINKRNAPTPADIIEGIKAILAEQKPLNSGRKLGDVRCADCEDSGFAWVDFAGRGTVVRCQKGCQPLPEFEKRPESGKIADNVNWGSRLKENQIANAARRKKVGPEAYLRERGFNPKKFRIQDGLILAVPLSVVESKFRRK